MNIEYYLSIRRYVEIGFWCVFFSLVLIAETTVVLIEVDNRNLPFQIWEVICWEVSSIFVLLCLIPVLVKFDQYFPLSWKTLKRSIGMHLLFTVVFSVLHVSSMVGIRELVYWYVGIEYIFGDVFRNFAYEYAKDIRSYAIILSLIYLYRHIVFRAQGEASVLTESDGDENTDKPSQDTERLLVKKLGREFLINTKDVERIEAAGNYVNLHVNGRVYPLRETMNKILHRLDPTSFKRVHRSHIVNLNYIKEIVPIESGDAAVVMQSGQKAPMSRTYRAELRALF